MESFEKNGRMYKTNSQEDVYSALEFFLTKLNPECNALFQYQKRNWRPSDQVWYENSTLGVNKLPTTMKEISKEASLSRIYIYHSVRPTDIALWAGSSDRVIMAISSHRSEASLRSYHQQPSVNQLRKCSEVLTVALSEDEGTDAPTGLQYKAARYSLQQLPCQSSTVNRISANMCFPTTVKRSTCSDMFNSCTIGNVNITFNY